MRKGFTLSEVLITLGVVGIVAVLTIPGVMKNYQNRMYTAQLQKVYSQISDAVQAIMSDEHTDNFKETSAAAATSCSDGNTRANCSQGVPYFFNKYFKSVRKNCLADNSCVNSSSGFYKTISNASITGFSGYGTYVYCIQLVSGAALCGFYNPSNHCLSMTVDVNGLAQPNVIGRDVFSMDIHENGFVSDYSSGCVMTSEGPSKGAAPSHCSTGTGTAFETAGGCLRSVIESGWKMEY